jgi:hypothetical protein
LMMVSGEKSNPMKPVRYPWVKMGQ